MKEKKNSFWRRKNETGEINENSENPYEDEVVTVKNQPSGIDADFRKAVEESVGRGSEKGIPDTEEEKTVSYSDYMGKNLHRTDRDNPTIRMDDLDFGKGESTAWEEEIDPVSVVLQQSDEKYGLSAGSGAKISTVQKSRQNAKRSAQNSGIPFLQPVGWLVCIEGEDFGKSFPLKEGINTLGRSLEMDIALLGDRAISRSTHALIVYEENSRSFLVKTGEEKKPIYVNDDMVLIPMEIGARDLLCVGDTRLMLIPCCDANFSWKSCGN